MFFFHFGVIWACSNGPKKVPKGPPMGGMYGPMFRLKNKPLIKLLEEMVRNNQKTGFHVFSILGPFGHPQMDPKRYPKVCKWTRGIFTSKFVLSKKTTQPLINCSFVISFSIFHCYMNLLWKNKNGQPLPGAKQFRRNQFSTLADFLFLLLFSKQLQHNQFLKWYGDRPTNGRTNGRTNRRTNRRTDQHSLL
jgi:hypothetical protein